MDLGELESSLKVVVLGAEGVGKTSMTSLFVRGDYPVQHKRTIGTEFKEKTISAGDLGEEIDLMIWEIGGEHVNASMSTRYLRDARAVILMFAVDDSSSFERIEELHAKAKAECQELSTIVLVQNKTDLSRQAQVSQAQVQELARKLRLKLFNTNCHDRTSVEEAFYFLAAGSGGSAVALADIGDVVPIVDCDDESKESSTKEAAAHEGASRSHQMGADASNGPSSAGAQPLGGQSHARQTTANKSSGNSAVVPRNIPGDNAFPTKPSKQRTLGQKRASCSIM